MAGIYIHIPFCKQACHYCNFHFATSLRYKDDMVRAICRELIIRKDFFEPGEKTDTIYFGGGTPSLLSANEINIILNTIFDNYNISDLKELTLEANPDDLNSDYLKSLRSTPVTRLSIGLQSFHDEDLKWMNRAHQAAQSRSCLTNALNQGFNDLTVDLIYGSPTTTNEMWQSNMEELVALGIEHISAYCLTVEEKTPLFKMIRTGKSQPADVMKGAIQFEMLISYLASKGFEQYEISNFAKNKKYAIHNTAYWQGEPYLGIGPSAHSYRANERSWNVANNQQYIEGIQQNTPRFQKEQLSNVDIFNETVMTGLRTMWGVEAEKLKNINPHHYAEFTQSVREFIQSGQMSFTDDTYKLTGSGKLLADRIASDLFIVSE